MIEDTVDIAAKKFSEDWSVAGRFAPVLKLDFTWPSLGVVDLLLLPLRGQKEVDEASVNVLRGASAYLGKIAYETWSAFCGDVTLTVGDRGVRLDAGSGPLLREGETFSVNIEHDLTKLFSELTSPMPVFANYARQLSTEAPIVSLYASGLCTGLCPYGRGPWSSARLAQFSEPLQITRRILAAQTADFYRRVFPDESLGQVAELYLDNFLFPPPLTAEILPGVQAVESLGIFLEEYTIKPESPLPMYRNMARMPDEAASNAGLVMFAAFADQGIPADVLAITRRKGMMMGMLRATMHAVRERYGLGEDWLHTESLSKSDIPKFEREKILGMHPWIRLRGDSIIKPGVLKVLRSAAELDYAAAKYEFGKLVEESPSDIDFRLQKIFFHVLDGDAERAEKSCRALVTEPAAEGDPRVLEYWGVSLLAKGETEEGLKFLERAYGYIGKTELDPSESLAGIIASDFGLGLLQAGRIEEALKVLNMAIRWDRCPLDAMINKYSALASLERYDEAAQVQLGLLELAPLDFRVYHNTIAALMSSGESPA
ncbi:MAG: tetratricopeptide repeat protein [Bdellovibrionales bacterium]|nr:tetratricopeptide repeat protein [Bdellovibrionales bacterium]